MEMRAHDHHHQHCDFDEKRRRGGLSTTYIDTLCLVASELHLLV